MDDPAGLAVSGDSSVAPISAATDGISIPSNAIAAKMTIRKA